MPFEASTHCAQLGAYLTALETSWRLQSSPVSNIPLRKNTSLEEVAAGDFKITNGCPDRTTVETN